MIFKIFQVFFKAFSCFSIGFQRFGRFFGFQSGYFSACLMAQSEEIFPKEAASLEQVEQEERLNQEQKDEVETWLDGLLHRLYQLHMNMTMSHI